MGLIHKIIFLVVLLSSFDAFASVNQDSFFSEREAALMEKAINHARQERFSVARHKAAELSDKKLLKIINWMQYGQKSGDNDFETIMEFIDKNPNWPNLKKLRNVAEEALSEDTPKEVILKYFQDTDPVTAHAMRLLAGIISDKERIVQLVKRSWVQGDMNAAEENEFLRKYGKFLTVEDYAQRIDRLLWEGKITASRRIVHKVSKDRQKLFRARMMLIQNKYGLSEAVNEVPEYLKNDSGFLYERAHWRMKRKDYDGVYALIKDMKAPSSNHGKWWKIKHRVIREFIEDKEFNKAYNVADNHGNEPGGSDYADAEWLAGWLALRFKNNPKLAYEHFYNMFKNVKFPVSRSRGAYWAARSAEENKNYKIAEKWHKVSAENISTFYGQLSFIKLYGDNIPKLPKNPSPSVWDKKKFKKNELVSVAKILISAGQHRLAGKFIEAAVENAVSPEEKFLISDFGRESGLKELSVIAAKHALRDNTLLTKSGYPTLGQLPGKNVEKALVLGLIRQESRFNATVRSHAGAVGMMQILPETARRVAKRLRMQYSKSRLIREDYNITIGTHYLGDLIETMDNSYVLAIASYNAGPTNVKRWLRQYGDIRKSTNLNNIIDWIETIPFSETRNYVQRVLENKQMYHILYGNAPLTLEKDLINGKVMLSSVGEYN